MEDPPPEDLPAYPLDGVLDLHQFRPREVRDIVDAYLEACQEAGVLDVRIIHGKGIGTLREQVHRQLRADPRVVRFGLGGAGGGAWGATVVRLQPALPPQSRPKP